MDFVHQSVLLKECIDSLAVREDGIYVDGTLGGGGHSEEILKRLGTTGRLIGIDQDEDAVNAAGHRLQSFGEKLYIARGNFEEMPSILADRGIGSVNGILLDLGVSSYQLDEAQRGFSYMADAPLDMRMDRRGAVTAADIVNESSADELTRILREYGEEKFAGRIAAAVVKARQEKRIETTGELVELVRSAIPMKAQRTGGHPAKRTFQAIRIEVNRELAVLVNSLEKMAALLDDGGRLCVITFHSLEDRIVKDTFRKLENPCTCPPDFPVCVCGNVSKGRVITRKPILPSEEELKGNSRAKSAKLRVFERIKR